jgi:hypothetical protein
MKRIRKKKRETLHSALMAGGPLDGLSVYTYGQPLLLVEDVIEREKSVLYVKHAYQMNVATPEPESLFYEYVGWLNTEEADIRSINPELN